MGSGGGSTTLGKSKSRTRTKIPRWLQPLAKQGAGVASDSLTSLGGLINGNDLVADFTGPQQLSQIMAASRALGEGGFFPTAQNTILDAASGQGLSFLPDAATSALTSAAGGSGLEFIPADVLGRLSAIRGDVDGSRLSELSNTSGILDGVVGTLGEGGTPTAIGELQGILGESLSPEALQNLQATANGDFLFGGPGFNEAVDEAVRRAAPNIISTFGRAGVGGATGGLAQTAISQAATDAFARQFAQERDRQIGASQALADLDIAGRGQDASIASTIGDLELGSRSQDITSADILGSLGLADTAQQGEFAGLLAQLGLAGGDQELAGLSVLSSLFGDERTRQLGSAELLANLGETERLNQLRAAELLPSLATADTDLLGDIGLDIQNQRQREISGPIDAQLQLMMAALGIPSSISPLLGQSSKSRVKTDTIFGQGGIG